LEKKVVVSPRAPRPVGPYSQAIEAGEYVFLSGQLGLDPATGQMTAETVAGQTEQGLKNLEGVLSQMGLDLSAVVKTTVFLTDMANFKEMNEVYASFFSVDPPARSCIAVKGLPLGGLVEIESVAIR